MSEKTPRTMACWRNGKWHADELANLASKLESELDELRAIRNGAAALKIKEIEAKHTQSGRHVSTKYKAAFRELSAWILKNNRQYE